MSRRPSCSGGGAQACAEKTVGRCCALSNCREAHSPVARIFVGQSSGGIETLCRGVPVHVAQ